MLHLIFLHEFTSHNYINTKTVFGPEHKIRAMPKNFITLSVGE